MYIVYSKPNCQYCDMAKTLLKSKNIFFNEVRVDTGQPKEDGQKYISLSELKIKVPNAKTVPVIFRDGIFIGGYTELLKLV